MGYGNRRRIGGRYEEMAAKYLETQGVTILEKNYRDRYGEIDLIGLDGEYLVFVEVKYRKNTEKGEPAEAVTRHKQRRIYHTAQYYLYNRRYEASPLCRFDIISILGTEIRWLRNAF